MSDVRDYNFQLADLDEGPVRDHFIEVQDVHDEEKIASLYSNGYAIHTEAFDISNGATEYKRAPGDIVLLSARAKVQGKWVQVSGYNGGFAPLVFLLEGETDQEDTYSIWNSNTSLVSVKVFLIYKRP